MGQLKTTIMIRPGMKINALEHKVGFGNCNNDELCFNLTEMLRDVYSSKNQLVLFQIVQSELESLLKNDLR